jgi:hypothetical protein
MADRNETQEQELPETDAGDEGDEGDDGEELEDSYLAGLDELSTEAVQQRDRLKAAAVARRVRIRALEGELSSDPSPAARVLAEVLGMVKSLTDETAETVMSLVADGVSLTYVGLDDTRGYLDEVVAPFVDENAGEQRSALTIRDASVLVKLLSELKALLSAGSKQATNENEKKALDLEIAEVDAAIARVHAIAVPATKG